MMADMRFLGGLIASLLLVASCGDSGSRPCVAGAQVSCGCPGGGAGVQICKDDGSGLGACMGCPTDDAAVPVDQAMPMDLTVMDLTVAAPDLLPCGHAGETCCTSSSCNSGLVCGGGTLCQACGASGQPCCSGGVCTQGGASCHGGTCTVCGAVDDPCCPGNTCNEVFAYCTIDGFCRHCGAPNETCCPASGCASGGCCGGIKGCVAVSAMCDVNMQVCSAGSCGGCGALGQPCCLGTGCTAANTLCGSSGTCVACGGAGDPCCGKTCSAPSTACVSGSCQSCGGPNQPCCPGATCGTGCCDPSSNKCVAPNGLCTVGTCFPSGQCATPPDLMPPPPDLMPPPDLTVLPDLMPPPDLTLPPDLVKPLDLTTPADLVQPVDLTMPPDLTYVDLACGSCTSPPAPFCTGGNTLNTYGSPGSCGGSGCMYSSTPSTCTHGCYQGACTSVLSSVGPPTATWAMTTVNLALDTAMDAVPASTAVGVADITLPAGAAKTVTLTYTTDNFTTRTALPMTFKTTNGLGQDVWIATIPGQSSGTTVLFFVEADDWDGATKLYDPGNNHNWAYSVK
jgi:hypothetical protein